MPRLSQYKYLKTNSVPQFDSFVVSLDLDTFTVLNEEVLRSVTELEKFDAKFLILALYFLSKVYNSRTKKQILDYAGILCNGFFNSSNSNTFTDEFLTQLGLLKVNCSLKYNKYNLDFSCLLKKSEEKYFHAIEMNESFSQLFGEILQSNFIPYTVIEKIKNYINLR